MSRFKEARDKGCAYLLASSIMYLDSLEGGAKRQELENMILEVSKSIGTGRPSLAQDVMKGRRTEVDDLNGYVVRKGGEVGVPTPVNEAIVEVTKRVETGELKPSLSNLKHIEY